MKRLLGFLVGILVVCLVFDNALAQLDQQTEREIERILSNPRQVYTYNTEENDRVMNIIDSFFYQNLQLRKAKESRSKDGKTTMRSHQLTEDVVVLPDSVVRPRTKPKEPISIWYESEASMRSFQKDFRKPSGTSLPPDEVTRIARRFVTANKFCRETALDSISGSQVIARKWSSSEDDFREDKRMTVLQRAVLGRSFSGVEVLHSKQIVDVHPETREILSYKSVEWTPIRENSGRLYPYMTTGEVTAYIDSVLQVSNGRNSIENVKLAYLPTDSLLVPVLTVQYNAAGMRPDERPSEKRTLLVILAKDLPRPGTVSKVRPPTKPQ